MPKRKDPVMENPTACIIFNELDEYARIKQFYPVQGALLSYMTKEQFNETTRKWEPARYPDMRRGTFYYWFSRLEEEGYIKVERSSGAVRCVHLMIVEKEGVSLS